MTETDAFLTLNMLPHIGPVRVRKLLNAFGRPSALLEAPLTDLRQVDGIGREAAGAIHHWKDHADPAAEKRRIKAFGANILTLGDDAYPRPLREIHDPPIVLYVWGDLPSQSRAIGVVGTRKPTHYAAECAKRLSYQLAYSGVTVVSGLARGVDTAAHQAALAARGSTIAVLGSGLENLYPPENQGLAEKIAAGGGAVVTEFSMTVTADKQTFPMRNRIISGLSCGLLVIEAGVKSGALISAAQAGEQGRSLYAVPGRIDQPNALGTNRLIQQGAKLVIDASDILDDFGLLFPEPSPLSPCVPTAILSETERLVRQAIGDEETSIDAIIAKCGLPTPEVSSTLLALEMRKLVKQLPGSRFVKIQ